MGNLIITINNIFKRTKLFSVKSIVYRKLLREIIHLHKFAIQEVKLDFYVKWRSNGSWSVEIRNSHSYHNVSRKFCEIVFSIDKTSNKSNRFDEIFWNVSLQTKGSVVGREISRLEFRDEKCCLVPSRNFESLVLSCLESKFQSGLKSWLVSIWFWKFFRQNG